MSSRRISGSTRAEPRADPQAAHDAAVALLARRDFTGAELLDKLLSRGFDPQTAQSVVSALYQQGLLNDERYAEHYVTYHAGRGQGPLRIGAELRRSGLPAALVESALAGGPDWGALARRVRRAKFGTQEPASWAQKARQARFLQYRGFSSDHIRTATGADPEAGSIDP